MSLGSLTTRFVPSATCVTASEIWLVWSSPWPTLSSGDPTEGWWLQVGPTVNTDCFPPSYTQATTAFYSPAQCPSGYTWAEQASNTYVGSVVETTQTCCPTAYPFSIRTLTASSDFATYPFFSTMPCAFQVTESTDITGTELHSGTQTRFTESVPLGGGFNAFGIVVRFQSTDFQATTPQTTTASTGPTTPIPTSPAYSVGDTMETSSAGLSTGAKAGIGAGVALGAISIVCVIIFAFFLLRKRKVTNFDRTPELVSGAGHRDKGAKPQAHAAHGQGAIGELPAS